MLPITHAFFCFSPDVGVKMLRPYSSAVSSSGGRGEGRLRVVDDPTIFLFGVEMVFVPPRCECGCSKVWNSQGSGKGLPRAAFSCPASWASQPQMETLLRPAGPEGAGAGSWAAAFSLIGSFWAWGFREQHSGWTLFFSDRMNGQLV